MAFSQTLWGDPAIRLSGSALFSTSWGFFFLWGHGSHSDESIWSNFWLAVGNTVIVVISDLRRFQYRRHWRTDTLFPHGQSIKTDVNHYQAQRSLMQLSDEPRSAVAKCVVCSQERVVCSNRRKWTVSGCSAHALSREWMSFSWRRNNKTRCVGPREILVQRG